MKKVLLFLFVLFAIAATILWVRYGGGSPYPDLTSTPTMRSSALEEVLAYSEPIGNVAVNREGRVFFTVHPEARPQGNRLLEYVNGASVPYPSRQQQGTLFDTPLGIAIDRFDRLWVIDHGNHGLRGARITAIDLGSGEVLRSQSLPEAVAPLGSYLQDLQVSADGNTVIIADASFWRKEPAIIVYDVTTGDARRVLESHPSVSAENFKIRSQGRDMAFLGGIVSLRGGIDGIALSDDTLYYGALNGSGLYSISLASLRDETQSASDLSRAVTRLGDKPMSDGFSTDLDGNIYITDVEHNSVLRMSASGQLTTLVRSREVRWPDALSFGPDDYLYVADSALPEVVLRSEEHIDAQAPYRIFRFRPGTAGHPGQ